MSIFNELESNVQTYANAFPKVFDRALNAEVWDLQGNRYLDFLAGAGSLNYGHNNPVIKEELLKYIHSDSITHSLDLHTKAKEVFLTQFNDYILRPRMLDYCVQFTGPTGTNAVEAAFKLARKITGRSHIVHFTNGFHGVTQGALAATANRYHRRAAFAPLINTIAMPYDGYFGSSVNTLEYFERFLKDPSSGIDYPAAVIVETIQGEGGLNVASDSWLQSLRKLCTDNGILLIVDDIQAGCGRSGSWFSFDKSGITPDIVTQSKSLSGYGLPFAVVLLKKSLDAWQPGEHNGTFRGNNYAFITSATMLEHYWKTPEFSQSIQSKSVLLKNRLEHLVQKYPQHFAQVRGLGMMQGVVCVDPEFSAKLSRTAFEYGLIIERVGPYDEVIKCLMPLTIEEAHLAEGLDILEKSIRMLNKSTFCKPLRADAKAPASVTTIQETMIV